jgi:hypothetical protein
MKATMHHLRRLMIAGVLAVAVAGGTLSIRGEHSPMLSWQPATAEASPMVDPVFDTASRSGDQDSRPPKDLFQSPPQQFTLSNDAWYLSDDTWYLRGHYGMLPVTLDDILAGKLPVRLCAFGILHGKW